MGFRYNLRKIKLHGKPVVLWGSHQASQSQLWMDGSDGVMSRLAGWVYVVRSLALNTHTRAHTHTHTHTEIMGLRIPQRVTDGLWDP